MLSLEQIMELQDKGFTYEQMQVLNAMNFTIPERKQEPEPDPKQEPEPDPKQEQKPDPKQEPEQKQEPEKDAELYKKIDELTSTVKALQEQNVKKAEQDIPKPLTAEDVIKSFMQAS